MKRIVVVGAGLAGLRTAERLSRLGFEGTIVVVGDESRAPYNRPPLSKGALTSGPDEVELGLSGGDDDAISWRLGSSAVGVDADARTILLADGSVLEADGLVVATGVRPRRITSGSVPTHVMRTVGDARSLRRAIEPGSRVLVLGAGFLGCEIATSAAALGASVEVVEPAATPLAAPLGPLLGGELQRRHESRGIRFRLGRTVSDLTVLGSAVGATLDDGHHLEVDVVVEAVGCRPDLEWLAGADFDLTDGVLCDERMRAVRAQASQDQAPVVAAGDVARFPLPAFDERPRRIEHWNLAFDTARVAAYSLLDLMGERPSAPPPAPPVPSFWSEQAGTRIDCFGIPGLGLDDCRVLEGGPGSPSAFGYHDPSGRLVAVALVDLRRRGPHYRRLVDESIASGWVSPG